MNIQNWLTFDFYCKYENALFSPQKQRILQYCYFSFKFVELDVCSSADASFLTFCEFTANSLQKSGEYSSENHFYDVKTFFLIDDHRFL